MRCEFCYLELVSEKGLGGGQLAIHALKLFLLFVHGLVVKIQEIKRGYSIVVQKKGKEKKKEKEKEDMGSNLGRRSLGRCRWLVEGGVEGRAHGDRLRDGEREKGKKELNE